MSSVRLKVGDLVRRDRYDVHRIIAIPRDYHPASDLADVECVVPPLGWLQPDRTWGEPWCAVGDRNSFVIEDLSPVSEYALEPCPICGLIVVECSKRAAMRLDVEEASGGDR